MKQGFSSSPSFLFSYRFYLRGRYGGLNTNDPHMFMCLNDCSSRSDIIQEELEHRTFLEEICYSGWALGFKSSRLAHSLSLFLPLADPNVESSDTIPA